MNSTSTLIIAEAGVNHNGDIGMALQLVDAAAEAGADFVKFQTFSAERLVTPSAPKAAYQNWTTEVPESQQALLRRLELTREMHETLITHCNKRGIEFLSTAFDIESVDLLAELGLERFKIPSGEITNLPYLRHIGRLSKEVILSSGMATMEEIKAAVLALEEAGTSRKQMTILHCTTAYPTPMADVNLRAMLTIRDELGMKVGYSDHTEGIEVSVAAVTLGARVIEKHCTLDRDLPGPDHKASLEPSELKAMVQSVRNVERAMGDGVKKPTKNEIGNKPIARKSIVAKGAIRTGQMFLDTNLTVKRPGTGISPMEWDRVIGNRSKKCYKIDEEIDNAEII